MKVSTRANRFASWKILPIGLAAFISVAPCGAADSRSAALQAFLNRDYRKAADLSEAAMRANPANDEALYIDARSYQELGEKERAKYLYMHLITVFPHSHSAELAVEALKLLRKEAAKSAVVASTVPPAAHQQPHTVDKERVASTVTAKIAEGKALQEGGHFNEAEHSFTDALHQSEKLGQLDEKICAALHALGEFYVDRKDYGRAYPLYRREIAMRTALYGKTSRTTITAMWAVAPTYVQYGDLLNAEVFYRESLEMFRQEYNAAVKVKKRVATERGQLVGAMGALSGLLKQKSPPKVIPPEAEELDSLVQQLNNEDAENQVPSPVNSQFVK